MATSPPSSIDEARTQNPDLGFALYALKPGKPVTLEVLDPAGRIYRFDGASEADVLGQAFPPEKPAPAEPTASIFD
ncbi:MAG: hypothetical protein ACOVN5_06970 [Aquidulcibacter sp.]